jgi:RNA polymerase sigma factor (TIGR02999 family)
MYDELRRIAHGQLLQERPGHTLSTTALVHEAYLRLVDQDEIRLTDRTHFQAVAARTMRQILVDYARKHKAEKRGGGRPDVPFDEAVHRTDERADALLALDEALGRLERLSERLSKVVECRYFGGLTMGETAAVLGLSVRTVERDWIKARGWLYQQMYGASGREAAL